MNSNYVVLVDENGVPYLAHHGIKGQKWGVRRYQNPDGTLTDAGRKRYGQYGEEYLKAKQEKKDAQKAYNKAFSKAYNKSYQSYSLFKKNRDASEERWNNAYDAAKRSRDADKNYREVRKKMRDDTGRSYSAKLKNQNYQPYSKTNLPVVAIGKHYIENTKYWMAKGSEIKAMDSGKAKALINAFLDQPMHVSGFTGTSDTTLRKRFANQFTEFY